MKILDYSKIPVRPFHEVFDFLPPLEEGDFDWQPESAEEWVPMWCDDCDTWHREAFQWGFKREGTKVTVTLHQCDADGNWEISAEYESDEPGAWEEFYKWYWAPHAYENACAWAEYFDWMLDNNLEDPIGEVIHELEAEKIKAWRDTYERQANLEYDRLMK